MLLLSSTNYWESIEKMKPGSSQRCMLIGWQVKGISCSNGSSD